MANDDEIWKNNLRRIRKQKGYTQRDIQTAIDIGQTTLSAIERGRISGRKHMDAIARIIHANAKDIFPYYDYLTFEEAAEELGVSSTLVSRRVKEGKLKYHQKGNLKFIKRSDIKNENIKKRTRPSIRQVVISALSDVTSGLTSTELMEYFKPFADDAEEQRTKRSLQSILSRSKDFVDDKTTYPPKWNLFKDEE